MVGREKYLSFGRPVFPRWLQNWKLSPAENLEFDRVQSYCPLHTADATKLDVFVTSLRVRGLK